MLALLCQRKLTNLVASHPDIICRLHTMGLTRNVLTPSLHSMNRAVLMQDPLRHQWQRQSARSGGCPGCFQGHEANKAQQ